MDNSLTSDEFTTIFFNSYPTYVNNLPEQAFEACINTSKPILSTVEKECIKNYTKLYLRTLDLSAGHFASKLIKNE